MYRGIVPPILVEAPKRAVKFAANSAYQPLFTPVKGPIPRWGSVAAGVCAGCTEALIVVPFELVKIRLQAKENAGKYKNTLDCVIKIARSEGPVCCHPAFFQCSSHVFPLPLQRKTTPTNNEYYPRRTEGEGKGAGMSNSFLFFPTTVPLI